jgi:hypothetical protein
LMAMVIVMVKVTIMIITVDGEAATSLRHTQVYEHTHA